MLIVSFDIASKSLAVSILDFNDAFEEESHAITNELIGKIHSMDAIPAAKYARECIKKIATIYDDIVKLLYLDVVDLIPGKKVDKTAKELRATRLQGYLRCIDEVIKKHKCRGVQKTTVFLEYQMSVNYKANFIFSQIMGHFADENCEFKSVMHHDVPKSLKPKLYLGLQIHKIITVKPVVKNSINFDKDQPFSHFLAKYAKKHTARKKHATANMMFWLNQTNNMHMVEKVKKENLDDVADSITQAVVWLVLYRSLL